MGKQSKKNAKVEEMDDDTIAGIGSFRPQWLQQFATAKVFLFLFCVVGVLQALYYTYFIGLITTLEKRFAFGSRTSSFLLMMDEMTPLFIGVFVGYFGGKMHRPRVVGFGMLLSVGCCLLSAFPHFIYGPTQHLLSTTIKNETGPEVCSSELKKEHCEADERPHTISAVIFFAIASLLKGFGNIVYIAVGIPYIDDNAKKKNTPVYLAVSIALRLLGPLVGFLWSAIFLKIYQSPFEDPGFGPEDPRWIGGWWIGFVAEAVLLFIFTLPLFLFPRRLPSHPKPTTSHTEEDLISHFKAIVAAVRKLATNPIFISLEIYACSSVFGTAGIGTMLPKYMENQFRLTASDASLYSGTMSLALSICTIIIGGILIWKFRPNPKYLLASMIATDIIKAVGFFILIIPQCEKIEMSSYGLDAKGLILTSDCNMNCNCTTNGFYPVCGPDEKTTYVSPCYAGCSIQGSSLPSSEKGKNMFENCACVTALPGIQNISTTQGICPDDNCWSQALAYIIIFPFLDAVTSLVRVAHVMVLLRCVHPKDKSIALGFFDALLCLFGFVPVLSVSGYVVDTVCLIWEESCGDTGNCWFYDLDKLNYLLHGCAGGFTLFSSLCLLVVFFKREKLRSFYDEDEYEEAEVGKNMNEMELKNKCAEE